MDNWGKQDRQSYQDDLHITYRREKGGKEINLQKATKEMVERIVAQGRVENKEERILISTAALLCDFLLSKGGNCQPTARLWEYQRDVGLFFPPLVEAILEWIKEGKPEHY